MVCTKFNWEGRENRKKKKRWSITNHHCNHYTVKDGVVELQTSQQKIKEIFFEA
jgi:hypothetical protein